MWRDDVIAEAERWLMTPWRHRQRVLGGGVDCGQLLVASFVGAGLIPDFDTGDYARDWHLHREQERFLGFVETYMDPVERPDKGDVAVFKYGHCFAHGSLVIAWPSIIHAFLPDRVVSYGDASKGELARLRNGAPRQVKFYSIAGRLA